jgi:hypothetical protein
VSQVDRQVQRASVLKNEFGWSSLPHERKPMTEENQPLKFNNIHCSRTSHEDNVPVFFSVFVNDGKNKLQYHETMNEGKENHVVDKTLQDS